MKKGPLLLSSFILVQRSGIPLSSHPISIGYPENSAFRQRVSLQQVLAGLRPESKKGKVLLTSRPLESKAAPSIGGGGEAGNSMYQCQVSATTDSVP